MAMLESWLTDVEQLGSHVKELAGEAAMQQGSRAANVTPFLAGSDAHSHAPHLYAQLGVHRTALEQMRALKATLHAGLNETGVYVLLVDTLVHGLP